MAFSGGTFSRTFDCTTDRDNGVKILSSKFDTELDGMATGLSTTILKDGTQTCTAAIPFAQGITIADNKTITLGTNSDVTIQYDETTNDSLEIAAAVEGAALGIVLKADQGDDAGDEWKLNIADGGTLTLGNDINSAGTYVTHLTITPNATVASSTTAVAGNLTIGGALTLGSGAVISEAELETIDGITPGTAAASKAMVLDASLDISGGRNLTISGELDAATLDVSGDVDIDGTLETDALSIASTAVTATAAELNILDGVTSTAAELNILDGVTATTAELNYSDTGAAVGTVVASKVVTADANKDVASFRNITLTGELDAGSLDVSGDADIDGTLEADAMTLNGTAITATATLDTGISNNNVPKFTSGVADDDFLRVSGTAIEGRSAAEVLSDIGASAVAGSDSIVTTGALNAGSITSGFGAIDNGSSAITTTGTATAGLLNVDNLRLDANTISSTNTNGDVTIDPAGTGQISLSAPVEVQSTGGATPTYSHTNNGEGLTFRYNDDSGARAADIVATANTPAGATMAMRFFTNPNSTDAAAEVMRIANNVVSVGGTNATAKFNIVGQGGSNVQVQNNIATGTGGMVQIGFINDNGLVGSIQTSGSATSYVTSSDARLKENVTYDWDATTRLKQLKPARFNFIADADTTVDGFLADEAQTVVPESVTGTKDEVEVWKDGEELPDGVSAGDNKLDDDGNTIPVMQGIDQSKLVPLLVKTIQELEVRITALEAG